MRPHVQAFVSEPLPARSGGAGLDGAPAAAPITDALDRLVTIVDDLDRDLRDQHEVPGPYAAMRPSRASRRSSGLRQRLSERPLLPYRLEETILILLAFAGFAVFEYVLLEYIFTRWYGR